MTVAHLLNRTFNRWRLTETTDPGGGVSTAWTQIDTVEGRLSSPSPAERQAASQEGVEIDHTLYLEGGSDVARGERLVDGDLTVEVVSVTVPSVYDHHVKATARQEPWDEPTS